MPGSVVFDTAIGLVFVFFTTSVICSAGVEWVGNKLNKRGEYLLRGLRELLDIPPATPSDPTASESPGTVAAMGDQGLMDKQGRREKLQEYSVAGAALREELRTTKDVVSMPAPLADLVLAHPVIAALHRPGRPGRTRDRRRRLLPSSRRAQTMGLASYVSARAFASSLMDLLVPDGAGKTTLHELDDVIRKLPPGLPARDALSALLRDTGDDVGRFRRNVERWYDEHMGRVSGWYKRWAQWRLLVAGVLIALLMNVNSIAVGRSLYEDEPLRNAVVAQAVSAEGCPDTSEAGQEACLREQAEVLSDLSVPLGWDLSEAATACRDQHDGEACWPHVENWPSYWVGAIGDTGFGGVVLSLLGWLLTAAAVSFGAPFWFDALSKLGSLRTAGRRPGENAPYVS